MITGFPNEWIRKDIYSYAVRGCSSVGRAPALQAGGRWFDSSQLHQVMTMFALKIL